MGYAYHLWFDLAIVCLLSCCNRRSYLGFDGIRDRWSDVIAELDERGAAASHAIEEIEANPPQLRPTSAVVTTVRALNLLKELGLVTEDDRAEIRNEGIESADHKWLTDEVVVAIPADRWESLVELAATLPAGELQLRDWCVDPWEARKQMAWFSGLAIDWIEAHAHDRIAADAQAEIGNAISAYSVKIAERNGRPLTPRAAFALLGHAANRWFGGDQGALAQWAGLDGSVQQNAKPTLRVAPDNLDAIVRDVTGRLNAGRRSHDPRLRRRAELAEDATIVLEHWLSTGNAPSRSAGARAHVAAELTRMVPTLPTATSLQRSATNCGFVDTQRPSQSSQRRAAIRDGRRRRHDFARRAIQRTEGIRHLVLEVIAFRLVLAAERNLSSRMRRFSIEISEQPPCYRAC